MRRFAALPALALLLVFATGVPGQVAPSSREQELEAIRGEIARLTARLETVKQSAAGISGELDRLEIELELQSQKVAEAASAKSIAEERAAASEAAIADLERRLDEERRKLRLRLTGLYRMGRHGYLRMLLSLAPGQELLPAVRALRYLAQRDAAAVASFEEFAARLAVQHRELEEERQVARGWFQRESDRRNELVALERRKSQMLAGTRRESEQIASAALELGERARKISGLLDALYGGSDLGLEGLPIRDFRGLLDWPVAGPVTAEFGPRVDPRYGTRVPHNGLDIETVPGSEVRAVYPGKILFAAPFEGLGQMVVVQHAGRVFTLYAGLSELRVRKGDVLGLQAIVGRAGSSVYFEIRVDKSPENPRAWLR
ncbi:MAG: peptidoglycan DD-metalloendopeptidase family protein [Thermoanaerobaculia bacterium]